VWNGPQNEQTVSSLKLDEYQAGVGRLARHQRDQQAIDTLVYDEAGNTIWVSTVHNNGTAYQDRASYYGADGKLAAADRRSLSSYRANFEESRYDALGRRIWVRSRNACAAASGADSPLCRLDKIRRIVWDGDHELYEIQMPGGDTDGAWLENDVAQVQLPIVIGEENGLRYDLNPHFGRVAYTTGLAIDQPLSAIRFGYRSLMDQHGDEYAPLDWAPFAIMPRWTARGLADIGTFDDGGVDRCTTFQGVQRCIWVDWPAQVYAYARTKMRGNAWHGSATEDKADAAGTYYRRNRQYDPRTGRFTQEDPIGLAGGVNLYGFANGDPVNFSDPFGLCHIITDKEEKKKCKLRDPDETESQELDALEKRLAASENTMCRQAGGALSELRAQGRVKFWDTEIHYNGRLLRGDATPVPTGPVHIYSGVGANWTPAQRTLEHQANAVHELGHTFFGPDPTAANKLAEDCLGVVFGSKP
jgi:RHS repeat-associated protein